MVRLLLSLLALCALLWTPWLGRAAAGGDISGFIDFDTLVVRTEPLRPTSDRPLVLITSDFESEPEPPWYGCVGGHYWGDAAEVEGKFIAIPVVAETCPSASAGAAAATPLVRVTREWPLGVLPAGLYDVRVGHDTFTRLRVEDPSPVLALRDGRFRVSVTSGAVAAPRPVALTGESGFFSFFDPSNVELTIKILDGRGLNGHFWLFAASMTDLPFALTVVDTAGPCAPDCPSRTYNSAAGHNGNIIDTELFP